MRSALAFVVLSVASLASSAAFALPTSIDAEYNLVATGLTIGHVSETFSRTGDQYAIRSVARSEGILKLFLDDQMTMQSSGRVIASGMTKGSDVSATDRTYAAKIVARRTGMSQADAEKRVNDTIAQAKKAADDARKVAAKLSLWLAASMLAGALAASLAATEGGLLRDSPWYESGWRPGPFGTERSVR